MISQVYAAKSTWSKVLENERKVLIWVGNISEHHFAIECTLWNTHMPYSLFSGSEI